MADLTPCLCGMEHDGPPCWDGVSDGLGGIAWGNDRVISGQEIDKGDSNLTLSRRGYWTHRRMSQVVTSETGMQNAGLEAVYQIPQAKFWAGLQGSPLGQLTKITISLIAAK